MCSPGSRRAISQRVGPAVPPGPDSKTIIPNEARVRLGFRLIPNIQPAAKTCDAPFGCHSPKHPPRLPPGARAGARGRRPHPPRKSLWGKGGRVGANDGRATGIITRPGGVCPERAPPGERARDWKRGGMESGVPETSEEGETSGALTGTPNTRARRPDSVVHAPTLHEYSPPSVRITTHIHRNGLPKPFFAVMTCT
jgi:hypothetical protein